MLSLLPDSDDELRGDHGQHDSQHRVGNRVTDHLRGFTHSKLRSQPVPKPNSRRNGDEAEQPELPEGGAVRSISPQSPMRPNEPRLI